MLSRAHNRVDGSASECPPRDHDFEGKRTTGLGAWPEIQQQRDRILGELPRFDLEQFDKLEVYARAAGHAHALFLAASRPTQALQEVARNVVAARELLLSDAAALAKRDLLDGTRVKALNLTKAEAAADRLPAELIASLTSGSGVSTAAVTPEGSVLGA